jgi:hypothetical protein
MFETKEKTKTNTGNRRGSNLVAVRHTIVQVSTYLLTYSMVQDIILKADCYLARQKISRFPTKPEGSSPCSQKLATGPYLEPAESSSPHRSLSPQGPP